MATTLTEQSIAAFDQSPRPVPWTLRAGMYFGGTVAIIGWVFVGLGLLFVWGFTFNSDLTGWYVFSGKLTTVHGQVVTEHRTNFSEGGNRHDSDSGTPVYRIDYRFTDTQGRSHQSTGYVTSWNAMAKGDSVRIEYPVGDPGTSRIHGGRRAPLGLLGLFPVIFPLVGAGFIIGTLLYAQRRFHILRHGRLAAGKLTDQSATNTEVNGRTVFKLTYQFTDATGQPQTGHIRTLLTENVTDDTEEMLLYDLAKPSHIFMLDKLPDKAYIDDKGRLRTGAPFRAAAAIIIPALAVVVNAIVMWFMFIQ